MCVKGFEGIAWLSTCLGLELESMIYAMLGFTCRCQHVLNHSRLDRIKYCVVSRVQCREAKSIQLDKRQESAIRQMATHRNLFPTQDKVGTDKIRSAIPDLMK